MKSLLRTASTLIPLLCLLVLLAVPTAAQTDGDPKKDDPPSPEADGPGEKSEPKKPNLIDIARKEAKKHHDRLCASIRETIRSLGIYTDPKLSIVEQKIDTIINTGALAIPLLVEAMENPSKERTLVNSGRMAALILARMRDAAVEQQIFRLLTESNDRGKINALHALAERGTSIHVKEIEILVEADNPELKAAALSCLGRMQSPRTKEIAASFIETGDRRLKLAAVAALGNLKEASGGEELVLKVLVVETDQQTIDACITFTRHHGGSDSVEALIGKYEKGPLKKRQQWAVIDSLGAIGSRLATESETEPVFRFLKKTLESADNRTVRRAAFALNSLGDDTGVAVITQQLDRLITKHSSAEYYFRRGEIYLTFGKYRKAIKDFNEGLRKDRKAGRYGASKVHLSLARCYAAEGRFADAERSLRRAELDDTSRLPLEYAEFEKMAADDRYSKVFRPGWD